MKTKTKQKINKIIKGTKRVLNKIADAKERFDASQIYQADVICDNCSYVGKVKVRKGITINEAVKYLVCPNCGCKELRENNKNV